MKNSIVVFCLLLVVVMPSFAQDMQYVSRQNGDTLVVKDSYEFGGDNTLYLLMRSDSLAPAARVYFLKAGGIYSCANNPVSSKKYKTIIMGPEQNLKTGSPTMQPPIITGSVVDHPEINSTGGMTINKDLLVKNVDFELGNTNGGSGGWAWFSFSGANMKLQVDNCIMEHTWWTWVGGPPAMSVIKFTNDYFVNLDGHSCYRNGGVTDFNSTTAFQQDTLLVENCTHVNTQGALYKIRQGYTVNRAIFNHNDFIDCAGYIIKSYGDQTNLSITNNIYVNCQLQAYCPFRGVTDQPAGPDTTEIGLVNLLVDSTFTENVMSHGVYVDKNLAYWDTSLSNIVSTLNTNHVNGNTNWQSQMIISNTRTTALFANSVYPTVNNKNRGWINKLPSFNKTDVLFTTQLAVLKAYAIACVDTGYKTPMPSWRQSTNPEASNFVHADWPIPIDLSYTDSDLLTAGLGNFPVGDLGWFPTQMAAWKAQASAEYASIQGKVDSSRTTSVLPHGQLPNKLQLEQNYPNPFNPTTNINYTLAKAGNVTLKVYNVLGQEVATLVNGYQAANTYNVTFDASKLASGVYIYKLNAGNVIVSKKMVLMK